MVDENPPFVGSSEERAECGVFLQRVEKSAAKHVVSRVGNVLFKWSLFKLTYIPTKINICYIGFMSNYKRLFLEQYQYIFITIVTHNRNPILVENIETLKESIKNTHFKYNFDIVAIAKKIGVILRIKTKLQI